MTERDALASRSAAVKTAADLLADALLAEYEFLRTASEDIQDEEEFYSDDHGDAVDYAHFQMDEYVSGMVADRVEELSK